jgi:hypothetical protein
MEQNKQFRVGRTMKCLLNLRTVCRRRADRKGGKVIPADGLVEIISFNETGKAKAKSDLPFGKYYLKENQHRSALYPH